MLPQPGPGDEEAEKVVGLVITIGEIMDVEPGRLPVTRLDALLVSLELGGRGRLAEDVGLRSPVVDTLFDAVSGIARNLGPRDFAARGQPRACCQSHR